MTKQTLLKQIRRISMKLRRMPLSIQDARNVAVANGLMTSAKPNGKLTDKGEHTKFKNGKSNIGLTINYHKLAIDEINKYFK